MVNLRFDKVAACVKATSGRCSVRKVFLLTDRAVRSQDDKNTFLCCLTSLLK